MERGGFRLTHPTTVLGLLVWVQMARPLSWPYFTTIFIIYEKSYKYFICYYDEFTMRILMIHPHTKSLLGREYYDKPSLFRKLIRKLVTSIDPRSLSLPILAALTPKEHEIKMMEAAPDEIDYSEDFDLVAISSTTRFAPLAYEIADRFRQEGVKVVLGGWHPSALPEEAKQHADAVIIGEAEYTWPILLKDLERKRLKPFYFQSRPTDPKDIPKPKNLFSDKVPLGVQATRGCPYRCEFCAVSHFPFRSYFRKRPLEVVMDEIRSLPQREFFFYDNSLTIDPSYTKDLFRKMIEEKIDKRFVCFGNINVLGRDSELLRLSDKAGCVAWLVGLESISQSSLEEVRKYTNIVKEYKHSIKLIHDHNLEVIANFMFGFDHDTPDTLYKTVDVIKECEIDTPDIMILTPLPGTPLFDRLDEEGRILTRDWSRYTFEDVVFRPKQMEPQELLDISKEVFKEVFSLSNMLRRFFGAIGRLSSDKFFDVLMRNIYYHERRYQ